MTVRTILATFTLLFAFPAAAQPITSAEWLTLVRGAKAGDVIDLGSREVQFARHALQPTGLVTIRGGVFCAITLDRWRNVRMEGTTIRPCPGNDPRGSMVIAYDLQNVSFDRLTMMGGKDALGNLTHPGFSFRGGREISVMNSRFIDTAGFNAFIRSVNVRWERNDHINIREGLQLVGVQGAIVRHNRFGPYFPAPGDHADGIQLFTAGLTQFGDLAARDVLIEGNLIMSAPSRRAQGIFTRDEAGFHKSGRGFARITVRGNLLVGTGWHGITAGDPIDGLVIEGNRLITLTGAADPVKSNWILLGAWTTPTPPRVVNNVAGSFAPTALGTTHCNAVYAPLAMVGDAMPDAAQAAVDEWLRVNRP